MFLKTAVLAGSLFLACATSFGQSAAERIKIKAKSDLVELQQIESDCAISFQADLQAALTAGWPKFDTLGDSVLISLRGLAPNGRPIYVSTNNSEAAATVRTDEVHPNGGLGTSLTGQGITIGIWDGGWPNPNHQELVNRVTLGADFIALNVNNLDAFFYHGHPTHVGGTMIASGVNSDAKGMAYEAELLAYEWDNHISELAHEAAAGLLLSNHSYSEARGFWWGKEPFGGFKDWHWFGDVTVDTKEDYLFGFYSEEARQFDEIAYNAPYHLAVRSSGNNRMALTISRDEDPVIPSHWYWDPSLTDPFGNPTGWWRESTAERDPNGRNENLAHEATAKNILTVGMVPKFPAGYTDPTQIDFFHPSGRASSAGPTDDGRIKPDLVAPGVELESALSDNEMILAPNPAMYGEKTGTSMAAPTTTGSLALLQEYHFEEWGYFMRSSTLKALAIQTTDEAGLHPGPDYTGGWGVLNTRRAAEVIPECTRIAEITLDDQTTQTLTLVADGTEDFIKVTIVWTDPAGTVPAIAVDPTDLMLVNDLDMRIKDPNNATHYPWTLDPDEFAVQNNDPALQNQDNFRDNVEQIYITDPVAGTYTITINHKGNLEGGEQELAVVSTHDLSWNANLSVDAGPDRTCPGLIGPTHYDPSLTYSWSPSAGLTFYPNQPGHQVFADPTNPQTYTLTITDKCGNTATDDVWVNYQYDQDVVTINTNTTWNLSDSKRIKKLIVKNGAILTINDATIEFGPDPLRKSLEYNPENSVIVENNAKLILNNATLTNGAGCSGMWGGIQVWGDILAPSNKHPLDINNQQGVLLAQNSSIIENAHLGVITYTPSNGKAIGGIVWALTGTTFRNNHISAKIRNKPEGNCRFMNCDFVNDALLSDGKFYSQQGTEMHVAVENVPGVIFENDHFFNTTGLPVVEKGIGIFSINGGYSVKQCTFETLSAGIVASEYYPGNAPLIRENDFMNNQTGVLFNGVTYPRLTENTFVLSDLNAYGSYFYNCFAYEVAENSYTGTGTANNYEKGLVIYTDMPNNQTNEAYKNTFHDLNFAGVFMKENRGTNSIEGLQVRCNEFNNCEFDIGVSIEPGIGANQGAATATGGAGNQFDGCGSVSDGEIFIIPAAGGIDYFHQSDQVATPSQGCYASSKVTLNPTGFGLDGACPSKAGNGNGTTEEREDLQFAEDELAVAISNQDLAAQEYWQTQRLIASNRLLQAFCHDLPDSIKNDSIIPFLKTMPEEEYQWLLMQHYLKEGLYPEADTLIDSLAGDTAFPEYQAYLDLWMAVNAEGLTLPDTLDEDTIILPIIRQLANSTEQRGSIGARAILEYVYGEPIGQPITLPSSSLPRLASQFDEEEVAGEPSLTARPNPASGTVVFEYELPGTPLSGQLILRDLTGRVIDQQPLNQSSGRINWNLNHLPEGLYFYGIESDQGNLEYQKLIMTK